MADSEYITRADVERVTRQVDGVIEDLQKVVPRDLAVLSSLGTYQVAADVLKNLLDPRYNTWSTPESIKQVWG